MTSELGAPRPPAGQTARAFRFGAVASGAPTRREWVELARTAEGLGYSIVLASDHVHECMAPIPALTMAAAATDRLRVGTYVLDQDFRHPAVLAKELATLDVLSEGRLEIGIGAGWLGTDYRQLGMELAPGRVRVQRLREAVDVIRGCFAGPRCSWAGEHFRVDVTETLPRPVQSRPPLLIGGGRREILGLAATTADIVSIVPRSTPAGIVDDADTTPEAMDRKVRWVREAAGARADEIELNMVCWECMVTPRPAAILEALAGAMGLEPRRVQELPVMTIGSAGQVVELLQARRERWGMSFVTIPAAAMKPFAPVVSRLAGA